MAVVAGISYVVLGIVVVGLPIAVFLSFFI